MGMIVKTLISSGKVLSLSKNDVTSIAKLYELHWIIDNNRHFYFFISLQESEGPMVNIFIITIGFTNLCLPDLINPPISTF